VGLSWQTIRQLASWWLVHSSAIYSFAKLYYTGVYPPRLLSPFFLSLPADLDPTAAAFAAHDITLYAVLFILLTTDLCTAPTRFSVWSNQSVVQMDRYLRSRLTRSIISHNQSPTTAAPPTPIGNDTHKALLTVQHDEDHTLCIHAFIIGLDAGAYEYGCCSPP
jgi:hypothetical protein